MNTAVNKVEEYLYGTTKTLLLKIFPNGYQNLPKFIRVLNTFLTWRYQPIRTLGG